MNSQNSLNEILEEGINKLGLDVAIVSKVNGDIYKIVTCKCGDADIHTGDEFELSQTYCLDVVKEKTTKFYKDVAEVTEMLKHPAYVSTQLRAYIGTPIIMDGNIWGTLNYSSLMPHKFFYTAEEVEFIESQAKSVIKIIESQEHAS